MLGQMRRESGAPVRHVLSLKPDSLSRSPLARLLSGSSSGGGGRGGEVRLKLYLSLLWIAAKSPYSVKRPARAWAALLGLDDPEDKGARRVQKAFADLEALGFVRIAERPGLAPEVTVLSELGDGAPYTSPADAYSALASTNAPYDVLKPHEYAKLPSRFWTEGIIASLDGASVAMLLILLSAAGKKKSVWISPSQFSDRYGLANATQTKGLSGLRAAKLIVSRSKPVSQEGTYFIGEKRMRKVHTLRLVPAPKVSLTPAARHKKSKA